MTLAYWTVTKIPRRFFTSQSVNGWDGSAGRPLRVPGE